MAAWYWGVVGGVGGQAGAMCVGGGASWGEKGREGEGRVTAPLSVGQQHSGAQRKRGEGTGDRESVVRLCL